MFPYSKFFEYVHLLGSVAYKNTKSTKSMCQNNHEIDFLKINTANFSWSKFKISAIILRGNIHMKSTLRWGGGWRGGWGGGGGGVRQKWDVIGCRGWGIASVLDVQSLFFYYRKLGFRHDQTSCWSHPLTIPLHCFGAKLNNRTRGQFECDVIWFCFYFEFVRSHARCGRCSIVCYRGCVCGGVRLKLDVQGQGGGTILDLDGQEGWGVLKIRQFSWT